MHKSLWGKFKKFMICFGKQKVAMSSGTQLVNMPNDIKVTILGDSMSPTFKNGDKLILEELIGKFLLEQF